MSTSMDKLAKELKTMMTASDNRKPKPYDAQAEVLRVEDGIAWVHIPGGVEETPVKLTIDAKKGDAVNIHVANGSAWITGNSTNPPTDDTTANYAVNISNDVKQEVTVLNTFVTNEVVATNARFNDVEADTAKIHNLTADQINATVGYIDDLTAEEITASDISADHATVGSLDANYAEIDLANVNNAWIQNGVVKDAAISDAQIADVSANKLTAGTIDASNINVTNLNADNITAGSITVDGITIDIENNEANIDGAYIEDGTITMNGLAQSVQNAIDGAIETYTGTVVPTLNNSPASSWTTTKLKDSHIGDIYYVINAGHEADGYCYRFAKSGSTYSWVLIQDSDVTAALSRLTTAEGKIEGLESFESETSSWMTDTDEELSSVKSNVTSLTGRMTTAEGNIQQKVDTSTFNTLSQTVDENTADITSLTTITENNGLTSSTNITNTVNQVSQTASGNSSKISQLVTTLGTNADGTTKAGDIVHRTSAVEQDLSGFKTTVAETYATQDEVDGKADASTVYTKSEINQTVSGINTSISAKADASSVYTKSEIDQTVSDINASVSAKADGQETTAALALKANKDTLTSEINASADTVKINANRVQIDGTATFNAIKSSTDAAYDAKGAAAAVAEDIPTKVSELTNDSGYQTSGQVSSAISTATSDMATNTSVANTYATKAAANAQEQLIYKSAVSGTTSMSGTTTWITSTSDTQNAWTTKRPTYNSSYPVLFIATQRKSVSGTVTCTTPMIDDTTTIIDGGHIITGTVTANQIASAAVTADKLAANSITVGKMDAETQAMMPWTSDVESVPYLLRQSAGGTIDHDFTGEYDKIVGGTVAWNQLAYDPTFTTAIEWSARYGTVSVSNNIATVTPTSGGTLRGLLASTRHYQQVISGHKYLLGVDVLSPITSIVALSFQGTDGASISITANTWKRCETIYSSVNATQTRLACYIQGSVTTSQTIQYKNAIVADLTQMFGSTIADYIYNLETTTAGAGVAFFRKLFPNDYYSYDAGELKSVSGLVSHDMTGFNQFDKSTMVNGYIDDTNGVLSGDAPYASSDYIKVVPSQTYYVKTEQTGGMWGAWYDANKVYISGITRYGNATVNAPANACYVRLTIKTSSTGNPDTFCFNIAWDNSRNGEYEPYELHSYPLDSSLTLRGIPKLNGNNLYYDGDTYESDGTVTRRYGIVDLGTLDWTYLSSIPAFTSTALSKAKGGQNVICSKYPTSQVQSWSSLEDKTIVGNIANGYIYVKDTFYTDAASFKSAMSGVYLVYELATPTTETATSYASPQAVIPQGTEEYVTTGIVPVGHETTYASGSTVNAGIVASTQINSAIQDTQSYTDDVASSLSDSLSDKVDVTSTELSGKIDEVRTLANSKADSSALNSLSLQMQEYIGEGGYIYAQNGTLIIATGQNIGNFKIGLTGQQIVFYENDVAVAYIEGKKMYITRSEVTDEQKISNFAFKKRDGGRFTLMYVGG